MTETATVTLPEAAYLDTTCYREESGRGCRLYARESESGEIETATYHTATSGDGTPGWVVSEGWTLVASWGPLVIGERVLAWLEERASQIAEAVREAPMPSALHDSEPDDDCYAWEAADWLGGGGITSWAEACEAVGLDPLEASHSEVAEELEDPEVAVARLPEAVEALWEEWATDERIPELVER